MYKRIAFMPLAVSLHAVCAGELLATAGCSQGNPEAASLRADVTDADLDFGEAVNICFNNKVLMIPSASLGAYLQAGAYLGPCAKYGDRTAIGGGYIQTYTQTDFNGAPWAIGAEFGELLLSNLPYSPPFDGNNCWDVDDDGVLNVTSPPYECVSGYQRILFLPPTAGATPFKWLLFNWNPIGHGPMGVYDVPHFDFHFYIMDYVDRNFIRPGPCGELINCDDFALGIQPVPPQYVHPDYMNIEAVAPRMGNHLMDSKSEEFQPGSSFSRTMIMGSYGGRVTFWEPMISKAFFESLPDVCTPIKLPAAYDVAGYYPTQYCIRYRPGRKEHTVSLEGFVYRTASP